MQIFRTFNIFSVFFRVLLAAAAGGVVGYGRSRKKKAAGLRTYMLISMGASLAILLGYYESQLLTTAWSDVVKEVGMKFDGSRYATQVLSGIGFLGAGTILASEHQQVAGLTTAIGLFASSTMGMAAGAGMYGLVFCVLLLLIFSIEFMYPVERRWKRRMRNFTVYVEFNEINDLQTVLDLVKQKDAVIFEVDVEHIKRENDVWPGAFMSLKLSEEHASHSEMMSSIAELPCVHSVEELVS